MSETKYTPGPWVWMVTPSIHSLDHPRDAAEYKWDGQQQHKDTDILSFDELRGGDGSRVLSGDWCNDNTAEVSVRTADAALIAAATVLVEALKRVVYFTEHATKNPIGGINSYGGEARECHKIATAALRAAGIEP